MISQAEIKGRLDAYRKLLDYYTPRSLPEKRKIYEMVVWELEYILEVND